MFDISCIEQPAALKPTSFTPTGYKLSGEVIISMSRLNGTIPIIWKINPLENQRNKTEQLSSDYERFFNEDRMKLVVKLYDYYKNLNYNGWDGYNGYPIQKQAFINAILIIKELSDNILKFWDVFPSPSGTISFEFKPREVAVLSVGIKGFTYASQNKKEEIIMDEELFNSKKAADSIILMTRHLGYI